MNRHPVFIEDCQKPIGKQSDPLTQRDDPPPEEDLGGGDICSLEWHPPKEDDKPLD